MLVISPANIRKKLFLSISSINSKKKFSNKHNYLKNCHLINIFKNTFDYTNIICYFSLSGNLNILLINFVVI